MPLESAADFNSYVDINTGHGVTATFFEVQNALWDSTARSFWANASARTRAWG